MPVDPLEKASLLLMTYAGCEVWPTTLAEQKALLRKARQLVHPDKVGNRRQWDEVENAAKLLGIIKNRRQSS